MFQNLSFILQGFGNYAFKYDIADGHASVKSRSEVGDGFGNKVGSYSSHINHVAPAAVAVAHPAPLAYAAPVAHAAPLAYAAPLAHAAPLPYAAPLAHAAPIATAYSTAVNHVAPAPVIAAGPLGHYGAYAKGLYGHGLLAPALVH